MDLFSQNCPCCDTATVDVRTGYTTQNHGTHLIDHGRSCDEHPETDTRLDHAQVHAHPVEAVHASWRRRNAAFRRTTKMYAKTRHH